MSTTPNHPAPPVVIRFAGRFLARAAAVAVLVPVLLVAVSGASPEEKVATVQVLPAAPTPTPPAVEATRVAPEAAVSGDAPIARFLPDWSESRAVRGGDAFRVVRTLEMEVTAYCPCVKCCGPKAQGLTASGKPVSYNDGRFVAADTRLLKFGTKLRIPGYHDAQPVEVIDRGGAIKGHKLDVYFPDHYTARLWGRQKLLVEVVEPIE